MKKADMKFFAQNKYVRKVQALVESHRKEIEQIDILYNICFEHLPVNSAGETDADELLALNQEIEQMKNEADTEFVEDLKKLESWWMNISEKVEAKR